MSRSDPQINLRIPESLKAALGVAAKASGRSVNAEIVQRLIQTFEGFEMIGEEGVPARRISRFALSTTYSKR